MAYAQHKLKYGAINPVGTVFHQTSGQTIKLNYLKVIFWEVQSKSHLKDTSELVYEVNEWD